MAKSAAKAEVKKEKKGAKPVEQVEKKSKKKYIDRSSMTVEEIALLEQRLDAQRKRVARTIWDGRYAKMSGHRLLPCGGIRNAQWAQVIDWDKRG